MELLRARGVTRYRNSASKATSRASPLFDRLDWTIQERDRYGLIGPNGSGKSTLLRVLAGVIAPVEGSVVRAPGVRVALLEQAPANFRGTVWQTAAAGLSDLFSLERSLAAEEERITAGQDRAARYQTLLAEYERLGGYGARAHVREILAALGFPASTYEAAAGRLSSGERQRLALAAVLASRAELLLLDEPTNHLDVSARLWLEQHLARRAAGLVIVSHDRDLLSATTTRTAYLEDGELRLVMTGYSHRRPERRSARRRVAAGSARAAAGRAVGSPKAAAGNPRAVAGNSVRRTRGRLLSAEHLSLEGVIDDATLRLGAGDKIALMGPNGSGKSSLLALLAGAVAGDDPRSRIDYAPGLKLAWVPQDSRGLAPRRPLLVQARELLGDGPAQRTLAAAGLPYDAWALLPEDLSGGQRARAGLALTLARPFDLLLLDEPDNDLDLASLEEFETTLRERLEATAAALLLVTHDRRLALNLTERVWTLADERLLAHASVRAYLRGEEAQPAEIFWQEGPEDQEGVARRPGAWSVAGAPDNTSSVDTSNLEALEEERSSLLDTLLDPLALGDRERERLDQRLAIVEGRLMELYDRRLEPAGPSRRFAERGLSIFADPLETGRWAAVATPDAAAADRAFAQLDSGVGPWLELLQTTEVAHLRLHGPATGCLLPWAAGALLDAGIRLAFEILGVGAVQYFSSADSQVGPNVATARSDTGRPAPDRPGSLATTRLRAAGDGWWTLTLPEFLALEGWRVT